MEFLENNAIGYLNYAENEYYAVFIVYFISAFLAFFVKTDFKLGRGDYVLYTSLILLFSVFGQLLWLNTIDAVVGNFLSAIVAADILRLTITSYFLLLISKSRSNDAYGNSNFAALAYIPFGNLWLIFKKSEDTFLQNKQFVGGITAALIGSFLYICSISSAPLIGRTIESRVSSANTEDGIAVRNRYISYHIQKNDVNSALLYLKSLDVVGSKIDEITFLEDIKVIESQITYQYLITDNTITEFNKSFEKDRQKYNCDAFKNLISNGADITFHYYNSTSTISYIHSNVSKCG
jgi:hypothetical protein